MEEGDFTRQRRNVFVVSILIIAYNVGGGDLSDLSFQGMKLENTGAVIAMVWIAFAYVVWRYWLYAQEAHERVVSVLWGFIANKEGLDIAMPQQGQPLRLRKQLRADFLIAKLFQYMPGFALKSREFSDVVLPYQLAIIAVVVALGYG
jgi:hypothetical protein